MFFKKLQGIADDDWEQDFNGHIEGGKIKEYYTVKDMNEEINRVLDFYFSFCSATNPTVTIGGINVVPVMNITDVTKFYCEKNNRPE